MPLFNGVGEGGVRAFLGLGSNLSDREGALARAIEQLSAHPHIHVRTLSSVYETEPWGERNQENFLNMSVEILTDLSPQTLLGVCKRIESDLGRKDSRRWGPRVIDIDLLLYGNENVKTPVLEIPHAKLAARRFVLVPLAEIADGIPVPGFGTTVEVLLERCPDAGHVRFYRKAKGVSE